mmetsp:Transcript_2584/g.3978  ORF Transcript_2584/g.3978 Transcript_2584/m.3978 type:complete len:101 (+) Transcript_2584:440-742(+)
MRFHRLAHSFLTCCFNDSSHSCITTAESQQGTTPMILQRSIGRVSLHYIHSDLGTSLLVLVRAGKVQRVLFLIKKMFRRVGQNQASFWHHVPSFFSEHFS